MSIEFVWDDQYSIGNPQIDQQHEEMFDLVNGLPLVSNAQDIKPIIMRLYKHTREHFSDEEEMMKASGFPLHTEHRMLHEDLISKLGEIGLGPLDTDEAVFGFKKFIYDWLIDHILHEDVKYFQFCREQEMAMGSELDQ